MKKDMKVDFDKVIMFDKIIIHDGQFHCDDVLCCVMAIEEWPDIIIERKSEISAKDAEDAGVIICDVGRIYDHDGWMFDHHQDKELPSACILLWDKLTYYDGWCTKEKNDFELKDKYIRKFLQVISDIDTGREKSGIGSISSIIAGCNGMYDGFLHALDIMTRVWESVRAGAIKYSQDYKLWHGCEKAHGIAITHHKEVITGWKEYAREEGIWFMVTPNQRQQQYWNLISRDSEVMQVPEGQGETFRHNSGFMAVYPDYYLAIRAGLVAQRDRLLKVRANAENNDFINFEKLDEYNKAINYLDNTMAELDNARADLGVLD